MASIAYKPLPGRSKTERWLVTGESQRLWLGPDHVLLVNRASFREKYRRFFLKDIQAITIQQNSQARVATFVWTLLTLVCGAGLLLALTLNDDAVQAVIAVLAGLLLLFSLGALAANLIAGPTCVCHLYTAVQREELTSLRRLRPAQRFLHIVSPLIEGVQGKVSSEELLSGAAAIPAARHANRSPSFARRPSEIRHETGYAHTALFLLLLVVAADTFAEIVYSSDLKRILGMVLLLAAVLVNVIALIRQRRSDLTLGVQSISWVSLLYFFAAMYIGLMLTGFMSAYDGEAYPETTQDLRSLSFFVPMMIVEGAIELALGIAGLLLLAASSRGAGKTSRGVEIEAGA